MNCQKCNWPNDPAMGLGQCSCGNPVKSFEAFMWRRHPDADSRTPLEIWISHVPEGCEMIENKPGYQKAGHYLTMDSKNEWEDFWVGGTGGFEYIGLRPFCRKIES